MKRILTITTFIVITLITNGQHFVFGWNDYGNVFTDTCYDHSTDFKIYEGIASFKAKKVYMDYKLGKTSTLEKLDLDVNNFCIVDSIGLEKTIIFYFERKTQFTPHKGILHYNDTTWEFYMYGILGIFYFSGDII